MRTLAKQGWLRNVQSGAAEADIASREKKKPSIPHLYHNLLLCYQTPVRWRNFHSPEQIYLYTQTPFFFFLAKGNSCSTVEPERHIFKSNQISFIVVANAATRKLFWASFP